MLELYLQNDSSLGSPPADKAIKQWVASSLLKDYQQIEQVIRVVDEAEIKILNQQYRGKNKATNILSFPAEQYDFLDYTCLGDLVICVPIVEKEAAQQNKNINDHWAHLIVHGMLHLQGYDHENEKEAEEMELLEVKILKTLGIANPYNEPVLNNTNI